MVTLNFKSIKTEAPVHDTTALVLTKAIGMFESTTARFGVMTIKRIWVEFDEYGVPGNEYDYEGETKPSDNCELQYYGVLDNGTTVELSEHSLWIPLEPFQNEFETYLKEVGEL